MTATRHRDVAALPAAKPLAWRRSCCPQSIAKCAPGEEQIQGETTGRFRKNPPKRCRTWFFFDFTGSSTASRVPFLTGRPGSTDTLPPSTAARLRTCVMAGFKRDGKMEYKIETESLGVKKVDHLKEPSHDQPRVIVVMIIVSLSLSHSSSVFSRSAPPPIRGGTCATAGSPFLHVLASCLAGSSDAVLEVRRLAVSAEGRSVLVERRSN